LNNIKKSAVSRGENISKKTGQTPSKYGEIIKKLIPVFGEKPARGVPKPPPTPQHRESGEFTRGENVIPGRGRKIQTWNWYAEKREGGENNAKLNNSSTGYYFGAIF
jgi:hypothetical protein